MYARGEEAQYHIALPGQKAESAQSEVAIQPDQVRERLTII